MKLIISSGDPAGVGLDLCLLGFAQAQTICPPEDMLVLADPDALAERMQALGLQLPIKLYPETDSHSLNVLAIKLGARVRAGQPEASHAPYVFELLDRAHELAGQPNHALLTNPVNKHLLNQHRSFSGHTEYFQQLCGCERVVMLLAAEQRQPPLRVALLTTHLPLRAVADQVRAADIEQLLIVLNIGLRQLWRQERPKIKVAGLNPHAGEHGLLGHEEVTEIAPAIARARARGIDVSGPHSADSMFTAANIAATDAFVVMYHDQGLTVLKHYGFHNAINVTLGLPYLRVSVDHGTAYDLAATGKVDCGSYLAALRFAVSRSSLGANER